MLGFGWFAARQAQEALTAGRLEEAERLLDQPGAVNPKRALELKKELVQAYAERGLGRLRAGDSSAAWDALLQAEHVNLADSSAVKLRQELTRAALAEVNMLLDAGKPARALDLIEKLRDRNVGSTELAHVEDAARQWVRAGDLADHGEFSAARLAVGTLQRFFPAAGAVALLLEHFLAALNDRQKSFAEVFDRLMEMAPLGRWGEVLQLCDQILALAPDHTEARRLRSQAWRALEPVTVVSRPPPVESVSAVAKPGDAGPRFLLWIDGVGGYLVCLSNRVTLGQALPHAQVDVPIFADISRHHATLTRDSEGYLLEAVRTLTVNGKAVTRTLLQHGDRVTLGNSCQFLFCQPVLVSATARLDLVSGHRLKLAVDGVLLMADSLVLGPAADAHVIMPDLKQPVVLYRHKDGLGIRAAGRLAINGQACQEHGVLPADATVQGEDFSLAVEPAIA